MKPEIPANGILKRGDWGDSKCYQIICDCFQPDHDHTVWVEADETGVNVSIYTTQKTNWWSKTRWYHIWSLLTKGYIETEIVTCFTEQHALNYAETLKSAIKDTKQFQQERIERIKLNEQN